MELDYDKLIGGFLSETGYTMTIICDGDETCIMLKDKGGRLESGQIIECHMSMKSLPARVWREIEMLKEFKVIA